jgi:hypothetical protein
MSNTPFTRRDFLLSLGVAGATGAILGACDGDRPPRDPEADLVEQPPPVGEPLDSPPDARLVAAECPGYAELTENELASRRGLQYADVSPEAGQHCHNCEFLTPAEQYNPCVGCQLFAGPVAPEGWCAAWAAAT